MYVYWESIKTGSKGSATEPKFETKFGQSNNGTRHARVGVEFWGWVECRLFVEMHLRFRIINKQFEFKLQTYDHVALFWDRDQVL